MTATVPRDRSATKRTPRRAGPESEPAGATVTAMPGQSALPGQYPVPGSPAWRYTPGAGVWREQRRVLPWCPTVTRHLAAYSPRGEVSRRSVTVEVGGVTATVSVRDVADGAVWERFPLAAGTNGRDIRDALANVIGDQAARLAVSPLHPRWESGRLALPPADVLPRGYGERAGSVEQWRELLAEVARSPRMALVLGLAVGGLYVAPLGRQSYLVHLPGASSEGKTTTLRAAAAVFGHPDRVILPWSVTAQGPGSWLRSMVLLTGFRDELGASAKGPGQLESSLFTLLQGAERDMSSRTGEHRESQGSWHGALLSTGNESVVGQVSNEGIAARVVEITGPLTLDRDHALAVDGLALQAHGHGLAELVGRGPDPAGFAEMVAGQLDAIGAPAGGVPYRLACHLATGAAGVALLAELAGLPGFAGGVVDAARGVLDELVAGLAERGARPGDRLLAALAGSMAAEPMAWPDRTTYEKMLAGIERDRRVYGWDLTGDTLPGDVAVIMTELRELAMAAGINDPGIALRELRKRGLLAAPRDGRNLARLVKVGGKPTRAYVLSGVVPDEADEGAGNGISAPVTTPVTTSVTTPVTASDQGGNDSNDISAAQVVHAREGSAVDPAAGGQAAARCPDCAVAGRWCGLGREWPAELDCAGCGQPTRYTARCGLARCRACSGAGVPVVTSDPVPLPCIRCGSQTRVRVDGKPAHRTENACVPRRPAQTAPERPAGRQPAVGRADSPAALRASRRRGPGGGAAGAVLPPGPDSPTLDEQAANLARGLRGLGIEVGAELARAVLDEWRSATGGLDFRDWFGDTGIAAYAWLRARAGSDARGIVGAERIDSELATVASRDAVLHLDYTDPDRVPVLGQSVTELDVNGQFLASAGIELGHGEPVRIEAPRSIAGYLRVPGYLRLARDLQVGPAELPYTHRAFAGIRAGRTLATTTARYLVGRGVEIDAAEAIVWPEAGKHYRRHLANWYELFRDARKELLSRPGEPARLALVVLKAVTAVTLGGWLRSDKNRSDVTRRDWSDQIIAEAWVRALLAIEKAGAAGNSPMGMRRDSVWYLADTAPFIPADLNATAKTLGSAEGARPSKQLGKWKVSRYAAVDQSIIDAHAGRSAEVLNSAIKAAHQAREAGQ